MDIGDTHDELRADPRYDEAYQAYVKAWHQYTLARKGYEQAVKAHVDEGEITPDGIPKTQAFESVNDFLTQQLNEEGLIPTAGWTVPIDRVLLKEHYPTPEALNGFTDKIEAQTSTYQENTKMVTDQDYAEKKMNRLFGQKDEISQKAGSGVAQIACGAICLGLTLALVAAAPFTGGFSLLGAMLMLEPTIEHLKEGGKTLKEASQERKAQASMSNTEERHDNKLYQAAIPHEKDPNATIETTDQKPAMKHR